MNWLVRVICGIDGHSFTKRHARLYGHSWPDQPCIHCGKASPNGHRKSSASDRGQTGTTFDAALTAISLAALAQGAVAPADTGGRPRVVEQEILAERAWLIFPDVGGAKLMSVCHYTVWDGPTLAADKVPDADNSNGIYALRKLNLTYEAQPVVGTVALSGRVVEGDRGFRAERATVRSLRLRFLPEYQNGPLMGEVQAICWDKPWQIVDQLAQRYQCDVTLDWIPQSDLPASYVEA